MKHTIRLILALLCISLLAVSADFAASKDYGATPVAWCLLAAAIVTLVIFLGTFIEER